VTAHISLFAGDAAPHSDSPSDRACWACWAARIAGRADR
jgi:hypothetical protein